MNVQILGRNTDLKCYWILEVWNSGEFLGFKWLYLYSAAQNMKEARASDGQTSETSALLLASLLPGATPLYLL